MMIRTKASLLGQAGVGLIELLVSMFIGLLIMAGVLQMVGTTSQNAIAVNGVSRIQENTRYAFSRIEDDLFRSGNMGCFSSSLNRQVMEINDPVNGVRSTSYNKQPIINHLSSESGFNQRYDFANMLSGFDDSSLAPNTPDIAGTDSLMVRFIDRSARMPVDVATIGSGTLSLKTPFTGSVNAAINTLQPYKIVTVANCSNSETFMMKSVNASGSSASITWDTDVAPAGGLNEGLQNDVAVSNLLADETDGSELFLYAGEGGVYEYSIGTSKHGSDLGKTCTAVVSGTTQPETQYCALFRRGGGDAEELVDGVHNLQVDYGYNDLAGAFRFVNAKELNDLPALERDRAWNAINRIKITLSLNSIESVATQGNIATKPISKDISRTIVLFNQL